MQHGSVAAPAVEPVQVVLRLRPPLSESEVRDAQHDRQPWPSRAAGNTFSHVCNADEPSAEVFRIVVMPLVGAALAGCSAMLFTWGAPGTGKTHEVFGSGLGSTEDAMNDSLAVHTMHGIFREIERLRNEHTGWRFAVRSSALEMGGREVFDLLGNVSAREAMLPKSGDPLDSAVQAEASTAEDILIHLRSARNRYEERGLRHPAGLRRRHCVFSVVVEAEIHSTVAVGRLSFVDLAGDENFSRHGSGASTLASSSSCLGDLAQVVWALTPRRVDVPVPYEASPMSRLMRQALGGSCRTVMLLTAIALSPSELILPDSAMRFAARVGQIVNRPEPNIWGGMPRSQAENASVQAGIQSHSVEQAAEPVHAMSSRRSSCSSRTQCPQSSDGESHAAGVLLQQHVNSGNHWNHQRRDSVASEATASVGRADDCCSDPSGTVIAANGIESAVEAPWWAEKQTVDNGRRSCTSHLAQIVGSYVASATLRTPEEVYKQDVPLSRELVAAHAATQGDHDCSRPSLETNLHNHNIGFTAADNGERGSNSPALGVSSQQQPLEDASMARTFVSEYYEHLMAAAAATASHETQEQGGLESTKRNTLDGLRDRLNDLKVKLKVAEVPRSDAARAPHAEGRAWERDSRHAAYLGQEAQETSTSMQGHVSAGQPPSQGTIVASSPPRAYTADAVPGRVAEVLRASFAKYEGTVAVKDMPPHVAEALREAFTKCQGSTATKNVPPHVAEVLREAFAKCQGVATEHVPTSVSEALCSAYALACQDRGAIDAAAAGELASEQQQGPLVRQDTANSNAAATEPFWQQEWYQEVVRASAARGRFAAETEAQRVELERHMHELHVSRKEQERKDHLHRAQIAEGARATEEHARLEMEAEAKQVTLQQEMSELRLALEEQQALVHQHALEERAWAEEQLAAAISSAEAGVAMDARSRGITEGDLDTTHNLEVNEMVIQGAQPIEVQLLGIKARYSQLSSTQDEQSIIGRGVTAAAVADACPDLVAQTQELVGSIGRIQEQTARNSAEQEALAARNSAEQEALARMEIEEEQCLVEVRRLSALVQQQQQQQQQQPLPCLPVAIPGASRKTWHPGSPVRGRSLEAQRRCSTPAASRGRGRSGSTDQGSSRGRIAASIPVSDSQHVVASQEVQHRLSGDATAELETQAGAGHPDVGGFPAIERQLSAIERMSAGSRASVGRQLSEAPAGAVAVSAEEYSAAQSLLESKNKQLTDAQQLLQEANRQALRWAEETEVLGAKAQRQEAAIAQLERLLGAVLVRQPDLLAQLQPPLSVAGSQRGLQHVPLAMPAAIEPMTLFAQVQKQQQQQQQLGVSLATPITPSPCTPPSRACNSSERWTGEVRSAQEQDKLLVPRLPASNAAGGRPDSANGDACGTCTPPLSPLSSDRRQGDLASREGIAESSTSSTAKTLTSSRVSWPPKESSNNARSSVAGPNSWTMSPAAGATRRRSLQLHSPRSSICGATMTTTGATMMLPSTLVLQSAEGQPPRSLSPVGRGSCGMPGFSEILTARDAMPQSPRRQVGACQRTGSAPNGIWRPERGAADVACMRPRTPSPQVTNVARLAWHQQRTPPVVSVSVPVEVSSTSIARQRGTATPQGSHVSPVPASGRMVVDARAVSPMPAAEASWIPSSATPARCFQASQTGPHATYVDRQGFRTPPRTGRMAREASMTSIGVQQGAPCSGQHLASGGVCGSLRPSSRRSFSMHAPAMATGTSSADGGVPPVSWGLHSNGPPLCGLLPGTQVPCAGMCSPRLPSEPIVHGGQATPQRAPCRDASVPLQGAGGACQGILPSSHPHAHPETLPRQLPTPLLPAPAPSLLPAQVPCQLGAKPLTLLGPPTPGLQHPAPPWPGPMR
mmetsp:Transcript_105764/g.210141  ORF Transcript_105764/g.210141 Transcript_105764/m.210141 type:complete len:1870 (+) Transcript_105764:212-5821(+)